MFSESVLARVAAGLSLIGFAVAAYLITTDSVIAGDAANLEACQRLADSRFAKVAGIDVTILTVIAYTLLFFGALADDAFSRVLSVGAALAGSALAYYVVGAEAIALGGVCAWWIVNAVIMSALLIVNALRARPAMAR